MKKTGFTLAELVITVSIIGIVAALAAPTLTNLVPDKDKVDILRYNALLGNVTTGMLSDESLYHPSSVYNVATGETTLCEGLPCINNCEAVIKQRVGLDNSGVMGNSVWTFTGSAAGGFTVSIDLDRNKTGCSYSATCNTSRQVDTYILKIDSYGTVTPGDALTDAYLRNPFNANDRQEDFKKAKALAATKTY